MIQLAFVLIIPPFPLFHMSTLSQRGRACNRPMPKYLVNSFNAWKDVYNPNTNPDGYINLAVAENLLSLDHVAEALSAAPPIPADKLTYGVANNFKPVVAKFMQAHITAHDVDPNHIAILSGGTAVADTFATLLCDEGDKVLTTGPGYRGLEQDVAARAGAQLVMASLEGELGMEREPLMSVEALEEAWINAGGENSQIRLAIICSPNNPTGEVLSRQVILDIVRWGHQRKVHIVFDEVYAKSVHADDVQFVSVAEAMRGQLGNYVHILWSFSKDFCVSGCRVGVLYSQNEELMQSVGSFLEFFYMSSRHTAWALEHILSNEIWLREFFEENQKRLAEAYRRITTSLDRLGIPYVKAQAGFFVWADMRKWMRGTEVEHEMELWERLLKAKVILTPSSECFGKRYGYFRVCFAAVDTETLELAWERMAAVLNDDDAAKRS